MTKKVVKKSVDKKAKETVKRNTGIRMTKSGEVADKNDGAYVSQANKESESFRNPEVVGMNIGVTLNMDNYESCRIDVWYSDKVQKNETVEKALDRVQKVVEERLEEISSEYRED